jgi:hypothetical protein
MRAVGRATTTVIAVIALGAIVIGARSIPDIKRYLKIRQM